MKIPYLDKEDPWSSHSIIMEWLQALAAGTRVLDVGTGSGTIARLCKGCELIFYGIEPNPGYAKLAEPFYQQLRCGTVEEIDDDYLSGGAVIVCGDVLEHLANPGKILRRLVDLQTEQAIFIISVPNVANLWVRLSLLFGRFDYSERGILDQTHLRFFTRRTFLELLNSCCLVPVELRTTPVPLNLVHPFFCQTTVGVFIHHSLATITRFFPNLLSYQFVVKAKKIPAKEPNIEPR